MALDEAKLHEFVGKMVGEMGGAMTAALMLIGDKLGLYTMVVQQSMQAAEIEGIRSALNQQGPPEDILRAVIHARLQSICRSNP